MAQVGCGVAVLGHGREEIINAATRQLKTLDYAPSYQIGHELPFKLAERSFKLLT